MKAEDFLINLLRLNGGAMGHVRLQREAYLLAQCGGQLDDVAFIYRNGGPFSIELDGALEMVRVEGRVAREVIEGNTRRVAVYEVDSLGEEDDTSPGVDGLPDEASSRLRKMGEVTDLVLELAAAYVFIRKEERYGDRTLDELKVRKPLSASSGRTEDALRLVQALGLE